MRCRYCDEPVSLVLADLGSSPPSNSYLTEEGLRAPEQLFPLRVLVCESCWLAQTEDFADAALLFDPEYAYFSGYSSTWVEHCRLYADKAIHRFGLDRSSQVIEVASNDGTLLKFFHERGLRCMGIEPTASTAAASRELGLKIVEAFLTPESAVDLVADGLVADLLVANNVLAHVPDIVGFANSCRQILASDGIASFEFAHIVELVSRAQFDTIYHEHFSYLSLTVVEGIFNTVGLEVFDVEHLTTHGGSLRIYAQRSKSTRFPVAESVGRLRAQEEALGVSSPSFYAGFQKNADRIRDEFLEFLLGVAADGRRLGGYGAAAKGNTLLNYAGVGSNLVPYVVDNNPSKQGKYLPGSHIPIVEEQRIADDCPELVLVLPWNLREEIARCLELIKGWSGSIVTAVPEIRVG